MDGRLSMCLFIHPIAAPVFHSRFRATSIVHVWSPTSGNYVRLSDTPPVSSSRSAISSLTHRLIEAIGIPSIASRLASARRRLMARSMKTSESTCCRDFGRCSAIRSNRRTWFKSSRRSVVAPRPFPEWLFGVPVLGPFCSGMPYRGLPDWQ